MLDRLRGASQRKEEQHEVNIGRLRLDRVRVPRGDNVSEGLGTWYKLGVTVNIIMEVVWGWGGTVRVNTGSLVATRCLAGLVMLWPHMQNASHNWR